MPDPFDLSQFFAPQNEERRRKAPPPEQYFPAAESRRGGPKGSMGQEIGGSLLNTPGSTMMSKGMSALGGFMQTAGMGGGGAGGGMMPGASAPTPGMEGANAWNPSSSTASSTGTINPSQTGQIPSISGGLQKMGMSPTGADATQMLGQDLRAGDDPNRGSRNMGRILGLIARFYGG